MTAEPQPVDASTFRKAGSTLSISRIVRFADVAHARLGKMLDAQKNRGIMRPYLANPNVRWFKIDLTNLKEMPFEDHEQEKFSIRDGDVLICEGGEAGRAAIWNGLDIGVKFQKAIHRVRPGPQLFNRYFVHRLFYDYHSGGLSDYYTGATINHLTGQDLARYEFPLPPLDEQRRIAAILDQADNLRRKRREALHRLAVLTGTLFSSSFGDVVENDREWRVEPLSSTIENFEGGKNLVAEGDDSNNPIRVLKISSIQEDGFYPHESKALPENYRPPTRHFVRRGDLLLSRANTTERVGLVAFVNCDVENLVLPDKILRFVWKEASSVLSQYWLHCFLSLPVRALIGRLATGTSGSMKNISQEKLLAMRLSLPPIDLQRAFVDSVAAIDKLKVHHRVQLTKLDALFASLQHRAFRGEL